MAIEQAVLSPQVCIAGGGPAGVVLSLLLARKGMRVTLLESQRDFDRAFRGDTLHASSLEILDQIGLAERALALSSSRVTAFRIESGGHEYTVAELSAMKGKYPFVALVPQVRLLNMLVEQASAYPGFNVLMGATVTGLVREGGRVTGVTFSHEGQTHSLAADLVVGADGRQSSVREAAGMELVRNAAPMDVVWFQVPMQGANAGDDAAIIRFGAGTMLVIFSRDGYWQVGYVILKGDYREVRKKGIDAFRAELIRMVPSMAEGFNLLKDWSACAILSVVTGRVTKWYQDGLLLIGDAAHVMSPVGGIGINYAINDAAAAANALLPALQGGAIGIEHLEAVQRRRELPVKFIQFFQAMVQQRVIAAGLKSDKPFTPPLPLRIVSSLRPLRARAARIMAYGLRPERLDSP